MVDLAPSDSIQYKRVGSPNLRMHESVFIS